MPIVQRRCAGTDTTSVSPSSTPCATSAPPTRPSEGPRVTFVLRTDDGGRASVVFDGRRRRWFLEAVERAA